MNNDIWPLDRERRRVSRIFIESSGTREREQKQATESERESVKAWDWRKKGSERSKGHCVREPERKTRKKRRKERQRGVWKFWPSQRPRASLSKISVYIEKHEKYCKERENERQRSPDSRTSPHLYIVICIVRLCIKEEDEKKQMKKQTKKQKECTWIAYVPA